MELEVIKRLFLMSLIQRKSLPFILYALQIKIILFNFILESLNYFINLLILNVYPY